MVLLLLSAPRAVAKWRALIGPWDPAIARAAAPGCLRARHGTSALRNAVHGSQSAEAAVREIALLFPQAAAPDSALAPREYLLEVKIKTSSSGGTAFVLKS